MDLLIALIVIVAGFMIFVSLIYGAAKLLLHRKMGHRELDMMTGDGSLKVKVNKSRNLYSFK